MKSQSGVHGFLPCIHPTRHAEESHLGGTLSIVFLYCCLKSGESMRERRRSSHTRSGHRNRLNIQTPFSSVNSGIIPTYLLAGANRMRVWSPLMTLSADSREGVASRQEEVGAMSL